VEAALRVEWRRKIIGQSQHEHDPKVLDRIYICDYCEAVFLFQNDVDYHMQQTGHKSVMEMPFSCIDHDPNDQDDVR
jgi:hypothetical protein